jgi:putative FmdB family regulatory protein
MPLFEYYCKKCVRRFEVLMASSQDSAVGCCPSCGRKCRRQWSTFSAIVAGITDERQTTESGRVRPGYEQAGASIALCGGSGTIEDCTVSGAKGVTGFGLFGNTQATIKNCTVNNADVGVSVTPGTRVKISGLKTHGVSSALEVVRRRGPSWKRLD